MKTVSIIIARGGSKGIPKKNIMNFCGRPLITWTINQSLQSELIDEVYVSTDSYEIADIAYDNGAKIIIRPNYLATDKATSEDVILHALERIDCDTVVFPQVTSPIRNSIDFTKAIDIFNEKMLSSLFTSTYLDDYCIWNSKFQSVTYDYLNRGRRQDRESTFLENGSFYIFKPEGIKQFKNRIHGKVGMYFMPFWKSYEIDSYENIEICEYYMNTKILGKKVKYE
jgi:N-acylneuraminate cytidylyltransferase